MSAWGTDNSQYSESLLGYDTVEFIYPEHGGSMSVWNVGSPLRRRPQCDWCYLLLQQLKDALGEVVAEMENMDTADEG
jgi:hypothetical protein